MELVISKIILNGGLSFLVCITGIMVLIVSIYLIRLLANMTVLTKNLNQTTEILNEDLQPTLKDFREAVHSVNTLIQATDNGVGNVKTSIGSVLGKTKAISQGVFGGFMNGFLTMFNMFKRK